MDDARFVVEISGLKYPVTKATLESVLIPLVRNVISIAYVPRSGKAHIEVSGGRSSADDALRVLNGLRDPALVFSPPGQNRPLRAELQAGTSANINYVQRDVEHRWMWSSGAVWSCGRRRGLVGAAP